MVLLLASAILIDNLLTRFVHGGIMRNVVGLYGVEVAVEIEMSVEVSKWKKTGSSLDLRQELGIKKEIGACANVVSWTMRQSMATLPPPQEEAKEETQWNQRRPQTFNGLVCEWCSW